VVERPAQRVEKNGDAGIGEAVEDGFGFSPRGDQTGFPQLPQLLRQAGLLQPQLSLEPGDSQLAVQKAAENLQSRRMRDGS